MAVKWTDEQTRAIETTDRGVVVPAAAGSGKTAVLIERTVRLLADKNAGCPAENLLAVTFTKDAANQMKTKLRAALSARILTEKDPETKAWLTRQQDMLPLAKISTINSFCLELVKDNLNEFDYRAGIKVADEAEAQVILDEAIEQTFEELRGENPDMMEELMDALANNSDWELAKYVRQVYRFFSSLPFPEKWTESAAERLTDKDRIADYIQAVMYDYGMTLDKAEKLNENARYIAGKMINGAKTLALLADDLEKLEDLRVAVNNCNYEQLYDAAKSIKFDTMRKPAAKGLTQEESILMVHDFEMIKTLRDRMKKTVGSLSTDMQYMGRDIYAPMAFSAKIFSSLCTVYERLVKNMHERKTEKGVAEFSDIERMAMQLLVRLEDGEVRRTELAQQIVQEHAYKVLLIDEFQDVNNLQEMIFRALSDTEDINTFGSNVFLVGDVKQSIYRFRLSNPALFLNAVQSAEQNDGGLCKIRLSKNFRSRQNVVDYVNEVFRSIMSEEIGELEYTAEEELVCGAEYGGEDFPVDLMLIEDRDDDEQFKYVNYGSEELCIAKNIKNELVSGRKVWDIGAKKFRSSVPSDYCVLSRGKDGCRRMTAALESVGLKAQIEQSDGYMGSKEIETMVSLLQVIDAPSNDLSMASVMASPILGFSSEELAKLSLISRRDVNKPKSLWQIILACSKTENSDEKEAERIDTGDEELESKCRFAAELINRLRFYSVSMSLEALIAKIYDETDFFAVASVYENSLQKRANLRLLTQRAAEYEKNSTGGIAGFLRFLESVSAAGGDFSQAVTVSGGEDSVAVKTIHSSKGLEYPFVYLCGLNKPFNMTDMSARLLFSEKMGFGLYYMRHDKLMKVKTVAHRAMETVTKNELLSEEMRLLYVALTRAKEQITIPLFMKKSPRADLDARRQLIGITEQILMTGGLNAAILRECDSYFKWIAAATLVSKHNVPLLNEIELQDLSNELSQFGKKGAIPKVDWQEYGEENTSAASGKDFYSAVPNEEKVKELCAKYEFAYPNANAYSASKRTVTEIVSEIKQRENEEADMMFYPQLGSLNEEAARLSAAQRGTYTHLFMELAEYDKAEISVKDELDRLTEKGLFTEREAKGVYVDAVKKYFGGDFYKRVKRSDEVRREMKFMVKASDAGVSDKYGEFIAPDGMLQGICDCIFREDDGYILVDYKTDNFSDISDLDKYTVQLELYKAALDLILPLPVKACYIYSFKLSAGKEIAL